MPKLKPLLLTLCVFALVSGGCTADRVNWFQPKQQAKKSDPGPDIESVVCFYPPNMWQSFDKEGDLNPEGFSFVLYLISGATQKGVWTDGKLNVSMYRVDRKDDGSVKRSLACDWPVDMSRLPRRQPGKLGFSYQPALCWGDLDVLGDEVEIVVQYESPGGKTVQSQTHRTKVPARKA